MMMETLARLLGGIIGAVVGYGVAVYVGTAYVASRKHTLEPDIVVILMVPVLIAAGAFVGTRFAGRLCSPHAEEGR
jgi:hypothetical protein